MPGFQKTYTYKHLCENTKNLNRLYYQGTILAPLDSLEYFFVCIVCKNKEEAEKYTEDIKKIFPNMNNYEDIKEKISIGCYCAQKNIGEKKVNFFKKEQIILHGVYIQVESNLNWGEFNEEQFKYVEMIDTAIDKYVNEHNLNTDKSENDSKRFYRDIKSLNLFWDPRNPDPTYMFLKG